jgi:hypothetical protein
MGTEMWRSWIGIALLATLFSGFANPLPACAEAGSAGGSVGKQDKSISGSRDADGPPPHAKPPVGAAKENTSRGTCGRIVGRWSWYLGISDTIFRKDGTAFHPASGTNGKWTCAGGNSVNAVWNTGGKTSTDRITVSPDGNGIFVDSPWGGGIKFTGTRKGQE